MKTFASVAMGVIGTIALLALFGRIPVHAQTGVDIFSLPYAATPISCTTPIVGTSFLCWNGQQLLQSVNGGAYVPLSAASGVTSVTVNGGTPQTGAVSITIPNKFIGTSFTITPAGAIQ